MVNTEAAQGGSIAVLKAKMQAVKDEQEKLHDEIVSKDVRIRAEMESREKAELEGRELTEKISQLEAYHERLNKEMAALQARLDDSVRVSDDVDRQRKILENRAHADEDRISQLDTMLREATETTTNAEKRLEELNRKVETSERDLESADHRAQVAEKRIKELEDELKLVGTNLRSYEITREKAQLRETAMEQQIRLLSDRLREAQSRAERVEQEAAKRTSDLQNIRERLKTERATLAELRKQAQAARKENDE